MVTISPDVVVVAAEMKIEGGTHVCIDTSVYKVNWGKWYEP